MKTRMTLTIEPEVSHRAKAVARDRGTSLSGLVEALLAREAGISQVNQKPAFAKKWLGRLKVVSHPDGDARFVDLKARYGL